MRLWLVVGVTAGAASFRSGTWAQGCGCPNFDRAEGVPTAVERVPAQHVANRKMVCRRCAAMAQVGC